MKTAECVTPKHPDKLCDRISDAILDACLEQDPMSRVAIETMGGHGIITVTGELTTKAFVDVPEIVKRVTEGKYGVQTNIVRQSSEIAQGVDTGGAGDQGIMVGYACDDNEAMIPQELYLARSLARYIYDYFPMDGKTQVTLNDFGGVDTLVASFQNAPRERLEKIVLQWCTDVGIIKPKLFINPAGDWNIGGFEADTGLTGRKLMVDNYGPQVAIGGGCFSGKDPSKVDRSAAYMARKIAVAYLKRLQKQRDRNIKVWVKLAYAIGVEKPVMATLEFDSEYGVGQENTFFQGYDLTPKGIINTLDLKRPQYEKTAEWGHFGNGFTWDK